MKTIASQPTNGISHIKRADATLKLSNSGSLIAAASGAVLLFLWLTSFIRDGSVLSMDHPHALLFLHAYASTGLDSAAMVLCDLVTIISILIAAYLIYRRHWRAVAFWVSATGGSAIVCTVLKDIIKRPRPELWDLVAPHGSFAYPSGHATQSMAIALALILLSANQRMRTITAIGIAFTVLIGLCRLYLGVHYPSDILAGWLLATTWVCTLGAAFNSSALKVL